MTTSSRTGLPFSCSFVSIMMIDSANFVPEAIRAAKSTFTISA